MTTTVISSSAANFEKMGRPRVRNRAHATPVDLPKKQNHHQRQIQRAVDPEQVAARIGEELLLKYQGWYSCDSLFHLALAMDKVGVIDHRLVFSPDVRLGLILNTITMLIREQRVQHEMVDEGHKFVNHLCLTQGEYSARKLDIAKRADKRIARRQVRGQHRAA